MRLWALALTLLVAIVLCLSLFAYAVEHWIPSEANDWLLDYGLGPRK